LIKIHIYSLKDWNHHIPWLRVIDPQDDYEDAGHDAAQLACSV
jgi:hypothetical protein